MNCAIPSFTWERETRRLAEVLGALSFRDAGGRELSVTEGFSRWRDTAIAVRADRRVCFFVGNGASASLASHFAADLAKNGHIHTQVFSDPVLVTAVSNDCGFHEVFAEPLARMGNAGDMLVVISSSGRSGNVIRAARKAREIGMTVVTVSAMDPANPLRSMGDLNAYVPAAEYGHAETCHAAVLHYWMDRMAHSVAPPDPHRWAVAREIESALAPPPRFDRSRLRLRPLAERRHDLTLTAIRPLVPVSGAEPGLCATAAAIREARRHNAAVLLTAGAHLLRAGVQRYLIDLMERGLVSGIALNGGGMIHDFELALVGATTESVADYVANGQFGLWEETGRINDIAADAARNGQGLGEALGAAIAGGAFPHKNVSILAAGFRLGVPVTIHVGVGHDIVHEHPNCDGAAYGQTSYADFLTFAALVEQLEGGVVMNFGSAVMGPEVFLKALAMARNVAAQDARAIARFTTLVADLRDLPRGAATALDRGRADYYYRPLKTMLVRSVAGGGASHYVQGDHAVTFPRLWTAIGAGAAEAAV
jgi:phosphoheptose isomerase